MPPPPLTLDLRQDRDFGEVFNATFAFIRQNAAVLIKGVLFFVTPAIVLSQVFAAGYTAAVFAGLNVENVEALVASLPTLAVGVLFMMLAWLAHQVVVLGTVKLHEAQGPGTFTAVDAFRAGLPYVGGLLGVSLAMGAFFLLTLPLHLLICLGTLGVIYLFIRLSLASYAIVMDDLSIGEAFKQSWALVGPAWWQTLGVLVVMGVIAGILGYLFQVPVMIVTVVATVTDPGANPFEGGMPWWLYVGTILAQIAQYLLYVLPIVAGAIQYGNLSEASTQAGLVERVQAFGQGPVPGAAPEAGAA